MNKFQKVSIIGVPMDLGQKRRGVDMGPSAMRYAGLIEEIEALGFEVKDYGDIPINRPATSETQEGPLRNLDEVVKVSEELCKGVAAIEAEHSFPLILGGDHSISIGSIAGIRKSYNNLGVIWYDAHPDLNTEETSPSGNIHGMPLAVNLGIGHERLMNIGGITPKVKPEHIVIIGARSIDEGERQLIREQGIKVYTMHEVDRMGMTRVIEETIDYLSARTDGVHLSFDLDGIDPVDAPGVGTPVLGGISYRESHLALEMLAESELITSAEFVEINPILDNKNQTANVAVALVTSLLGKKLL
ncbi:arginase [Halalkalibacterium halodurans]|jgi:arginase|uniref:Arginase n=2 Tax=Halalkalibacterium halodurans TaxID=86665 RepID=Q9K5Y7_HALH5|nr:arginase [Halalkalibacterium halodurans]MED3645784.1 arginase [Halalkalibacterium halodurans]MED4079661.1 arginase [Halalkalibacterium halodurans]MED4084063.1 arginase [Halalkalibacterium halodurans]MED4104541.1 arginase [Halalkalibacterium halodurans]MED4108268.1 arginase [Halalkalibacterium halodurans]